MPESWSSAAARSASQASATEHVASACCKMLSRVAASNSIVRVSPVTVVRVMPSALFSSTTVTSGIGLLASLLGLLGGLGLQGLFVELLAGLVETDLPAPGWASVGFGLGVGMTLLLAFGLPPILRLAQVPALRVIRRDWGDRKSTRLNSSHRT